MSVSELFQLYHKDVFGIAFYLLKDGSHSEDIVMETFEVALKQKNLNDIKEPKFWLLGVAKNLSFKKIRANKKKIDFQNENFIDLFVESEGKEALIDRDLLIDKLLEALHSLKFEQSQCLNHFYLQGKNYEETAQLLNLELKAVKSHIQNGKRKLKILLEKDISKING